MRGESCGSYFQRRGDGPSSRTTRGTSFSDVFLDWKQGREFFLIFTPHDDDAVISVGLFIREARRQGVPVKIVVVTDGRNGYVSLNDRSTIVERRVKETVASYADLGVSASDIVFLNFPDGNLFNYFGRRVAKVGDPTDEHGYTGLENHFVRELRCRVKVDGVSLTPTRVFAASAADYHQDHVAVAREIPISLFHALGGIWPECGDKLEVTPYLYWYCVYSKLADNRKPTIRLVGSADDLACKVKAVEAYNSQGQIAAVLETLRKSPPVEYLLEESFSLFHPGVYDYCFEGEK